MRATILVLAVLVDVSCVPPSTTFTGSPKVPRGVEGCKSICASYGMELTGMVALGQYSDGCICEVPGKHASAAAVEAATAGAASVAIMDDMSRRPNPDLVPPPALPPALWTDRK